MRGDSIVVEAHHRAAAEALVGRIVAALDPETEKYTLSIAGESGSGKSETAVAVADCLRAHGVTAIILQQDDYYVYPPKTNDRPRRADIDWVGPQEVRLDLLDQHLEAFLGGAEVIDKPLVIYEDDTISMETISVGQARVAIAEGTYTTLLENACTHVFIDRSFLETRAHREKRNRHAAELDAFTERVLQIEHDVISVQRSRAQIVIAKDYSVQAA